MPCVGSRSMSYVELRRVGVRLMSCIEAGSMYCVEARLMSWVWARSMSCVGARSTLSQVGASGSGEREWEDRVNSDKSDFSLRFMGVNIKL